jgi:hypothetical protein
VDGGIGRMSIASLRGFHAKCGATVEAVQLKALDAQQGVR